jgi:hypothetical protein
VTICHFILTQALKQQEVYKKMVPAKGKLTPPEQTPSAAKSLGQ